MQLKDFSEKVEQGASLLRAMCPTGQPGEDQIKKATTDSGLPVTFEGDAFIIDPVRFAIFVAAYQPNNLKAGVTVDDVIENSWKWLQEKASVA